MQSLKTFFGLALIMGVAATGVFAQNYKIRQSTSISGQEISSTVYVKGSRKRTESSGMMGMGAEVADIEQCDLKRNVKVNDKKKLYFIEAFAGGEVGDVNERGAPSNTGGGGKITKGGTVTQTFNITDTGERKNMFGLQARHIKTTMTTTSSPDACNKDNMKMETDGWYVDLPAFSCPVDVPRNPMAYGQGQRSGCQDKTVFKYTGSGKTGFPLELTTTMGSGGDESFSQTITTLEFSKAPLADSLFDIPAGYTQARSSQDLYGKPDFSAMMKGGMGGNNDDDDEDKPKTSKSSGGSSGSSSRNSSGIPSNTPLSPKRAGTIRIGVLAPTNTSGEAISETNMQAFLVQKLTSGNVEGVTVANEAAARSAGCDYIVTSDFSKLKQSASSKIGGIFGKVTGGDPNALRNYDAEVSFKLVKLADGKQAMQNKAAAKGQNDVDRAAEGVLTQEALLILGLLNK